MIKEQKYITYKGKGNHSVSELEQIIEQREEELHLIKSGDIVKDYDLLHNVSKPLDSEIQKALDEFSKTQGTKEPTKNRF